MVTFVKVAKKSEIPTDRGLAVEANGKPLVLFKVKDKVYAMDRTCPHRGGPLDEGGLNGNLVMCPWHGWEFDVTTGACLFDHAVKQPTFEVKEEGDDVYVEA